jgi:hypothetical protein
MEPNKIYLVISYIMLMLSVALSQIGLRFFIDDYKYQSAILVGSNLLSFISLILKPKYKTYDRPDIRQDNFDVPFAMQNFPPFQEPINFNAPPASLNRSTIEIYPKTEIMPSLENNNNIV